VDSFVDLFPESAARWTKWWRNYAVIERGDGPKNLMLQRVVNGTAARRALGNFCTPAKALL
jgi:hypothetical protein